MTPWTFDSIPDQTGRTAIVTGANTGIGYETALALVRKGATVVLACRDVAKADAAVARIMADAPPRTRLVASPRPLGPRLGQRLRGRALSPSTSASTFL